MAQERIAPSAYPAINRNKLARSDRKTVYTNAERRLQSEDKPILRDKMSAGIIAENKHAKL